MRVKRTEVSATRIILVGAAVVGFFSAVGVLASNFQIYEVSSGVYADSMWPGSSPTVTWNENFTSTPSNVVVNGGVSINTVLDNAFSAWQTATYESSAVTKLAFSFGSASTTLFPSFPKIDCQNVLSFSDSDASTDFPSGSGIIAVTFVSTIPQGDVPSQCTSNIPPPCPIASCIVDADVMFNPNMADVDNVETPLFATSNPGTGQYDLQSVAMHEIGHMLGLDHSGTAHAVMFPYGDTQLIGVHQQLWTDDLLAVGHLYPGPAIGAYGATLSGHVALGGDNVYAAQVEAIDSTTGNVVSDALTDPSGDYQLLVFGGAYYVYVQSLGQSNYWAPTTIENYRGQAGYGDNNAADIPANATNYTGAFY